jgi:hypothetical protein
LEEQDSVTRRKKSVRTGSTRCDKDTQVDEESHRKLVMQLRTQTFDSDLTAWRDWDRTASFVQINTCAFDIRGRSRQFVAFMLFRTLESPIREKTLTGVDSLEAIEAQDTGIILDGNVKCSINHVLISYFTVADQVLY